MFHHLERSGVRLVEGSVLPVATATAAATLAPDGSATYEFDLHWELGQAVLPAAPVAVPPGRSPPSWSLGRRR